MREAVQVGPAAGGVGAGPAGDVEGEQPAAGQPVEGAAGDALPQSGQVADLSAGQGRAGRVVAGGDGDGRVQDGALVIVERATRVVDPVADGE